MIGNIGRVKSRAFCGLIASYYPKGLRPRYLLLAPFFLVAVASAAAPVAKDTCEKQYKELQTNPLFPTAASKIKQFESYAFLCAGSGFYEVQLAELYMQSEARDLGKAKQIVENALKQNMPYRKVLLFKDASIYLAGSDLAHAEEIYKILIRDYPNSHEGYSGLGVVLLVQHRPKESIDQYEKANSLQPSELAYRNLVIVYTQEGRYQDATNAFDMYYRFNNGAIGDRDAAFTAALAYANQGKFEFADGTLRGLLQAKPELKDDKGFVELSRKVNAALGQKK
jgi:tetratricopeptide (TPR) repeat protein